MKKPERLFDETFDLGEGPVWDGEAGRLYWVDIDRGSIWWSELDGGQCENLALGDAVGAVALCRDGTLLAAMPGGLLRVDPSLPPLAEWTVDYSLPQEAVDPRLRLNDGGVDPIGRFVVGSTARSGHLAGMASLWSFDSRGVGCILDGLTISNGIAWSDAGERVFHVDTPTQQVREYEYDFSTGKIGRRVRHIDIPANMGAPDGIALDAEEGVWVALWAGSAVHRYVDGNLDEVISVPTPMVTSVAFAGKSLDTLVITTARIGESASHTEGAGAIYSVCPGVRGKPLPLCAL